MIDEAEYKRRLSRMHKNKDENYYFLTIDKDRMLDAGPKGNVARYEYCYFIFFYSVVVFYIVVMIIFNIKINVIYFVPILTL